MAYLSLLVCEVPKDSPHQPGLPHHLQEMSWMHTGDSAFGL